MNVYNTVHEMIDRMKLIATEVLEEVEDEVKVETDFDPSTEGSNEIIVNDEFEVHLSVVHKAYELPGYVINAYIDAPQPTGFREFKESGTMSANDDTDLFVEWFAEEFEQFFMDEIYFVILEHYGLEDE